MKPYWRFTLFVLLTAPVFALSQGNDPIALNPPSPELQADSTFTILFNSNIGFSRAEEPHINRWLKKYGYEPERPTPAYLQFEMAAIPVFSRTLYSLRFSALISGQDLFSMNLMAGAYHSFIYHPRFQLYGGMAIGRHSDRITLNGNMPPDYTVLAAQVNKQLMLSRNGFVMEPALRSFWYAVSVRKLRVGLFADLGYDIDMNSKWKLGYYKAGGNAYGRFKNLKSPSDQRKASACGWALNTGISIGLSLR